MSTLHPSLPKRRFRQRGLTLVETTVTTAILAVVAGTVVPGVASLRDRQVVAAAAAEFETDVQHTRTLAIGDRVTWHIAFEQADGAACYLIHTGPPGECRCLGTAVPVCSGPGVALRAVHFPAGGPVALGANVRSMSFDSLRGTSTPTGTVRFSARDGKAVHQVVNLMGRVRSCSPDGAIAGFKAC